MEKLRKSCRKAVKKLWKSCRKAAEKLWKSCGKAVDKLWKSCGKATLGKLLVHTNFTVSTRATKEAELEALKQKQLERKQDMNFRLAVDPIDPF